MITHNGKDYLRVSEVIAPFTGIEFVPEIPLTRAAERGTMVHGYIEGYLNGLAWTSVPHNILPFFESWMWFAKTQPWFDLDHGKILEKRFFCDQLRITGQVDLIYKTDKATFAFDWKTSSKESISWRLQGAAYKYLMMQHWNNVENLIFVHLTQSGYHIYQYDSYAEDIEIFKSCLNLYRYFDMEKTRKTK